MKNNLQFHGDIAETVMSYKNSNWSKSSGIIQVIEAIVRLPDCPMIDRFLVIF